MVRNNPAAAEKEKTAVCFALRLPAAIKHAAEGLKNLEDPLDLINDDEFICMIVKISVPRFLHIEVDGGAARADLLRQRGLTPLPRAEKHNSRRGFKKVLGSRNNLRLRKRIRSGIYRGTFAVVHRGPRRLPWLR